MAAEWISNAGWLPALEGHDTKVVWVHDSPSDANGKRTYWRCDYNPDYKGNRTSPKPEGYDVVMQQIRASSASSIHIFKQEADDIAAAIVRHWMTNQFTSGIDQIFLATVDSDWHGLIMNGVYWAGIREYPPRLRGKAEAYNWLYSQWHKQSKKRQRAWALPAYQDFHPTHIWDWKLAVGDRSDNVPAGSPEFMVNLMRPARDHEILGSPNEKAIHEAINLTPLCDHDLARRHKQGMFQMGVTPPIQNLLLPESVGIAA